MKQVLFIILLASALASCRNFEENPVRKPDPVEDSAPKMNISVTATLDSNTTKTFLGSNGLAVNWKEDDEITIFYCDEEFYYLGNLGLVSGAGTSTAVFAGKISSFQDCENLLALYPPVTSSENLSIGFDDVNSYIGTFPFPYNHKWDNNKSLNSGDVKAAALMNIQSTESGKNMEFVCNFKELATILDFIITPTDDMVKQSAKIKSLSITAENSILAGSYDVFYDENGNVGIDCFSDNAPVKTVNMSIDNNTVDFSKEHPFEALIPVFPGVKMDEKLAISIETDCQIINVSAKASKDYQSGYKYIMALDLGNINPDNISITEKSGFTVIENKCGIFDISDKSNITDIYTDAQPGVQYGWSGKVNRLQEWDNNSIKYITIPEGNFKNGDSFSIQISELGSNQIIEVPVNVLRRTGTTFWLESSDHKTGYILNSED